MCMSKSVQEDIENIGISLIVPGDKIRNDSLIRVYASIEPTPQDDGGVTRENIWVNLTGRFSSVEIPAKSLSDIIPVLQEIADKYNTLED